VLERVPGKDYDAGVARYAFAAPFTKIDAAKNGMSALNVQEVA